MTNPTESWITAKSTNVIPTKDHDSAPGDYGSSQMQDSLLNATDLVAKFK
jgi:hypothetical protein